MSGSLATLSRNSDAAAASRRKSVSSFTVRASVSTTSISRSRAPRRKSARRDARRDTCRKIAPEQPFDARPQHFDGDLAFALGVGGVGDMHLRDRGGGDRLAKGDENFVDLLAERLFDDGDRRGVVERRHSVLQSGERVGDFRADDVRARREKLAELHIGRADLGDGANQRRRRVADVPCARAAWRRAASGAAAGGSQAPDRYPRRRLRAPEYIRRAPIAEDARDRKARGTAVV